MISKHLLTAAILVAAIAAPAWADTPSRVDRIKETKTISIGAPTAQVPFAFLDENQRPIGYSVEVCQNIAKLIADKLQLDDLTVTYTATSSPTRIPLIQNGTIDLECGNTTIKEERKQQIAFSPAIFVAEVLLAARETADVDVNDLASFSGKTMAVAAGGETFRVMTELNSKNNYGITIEGAPDTSRAFILMETGRADGIASDSGLVYAQVATSKTPEDFIIGTKGFNYGPYGIAMPKDDPAFKELVDGAVKEMMASGKLEEIYNKYFTSPIPPNGVNMNLPMSAALKKAIENPTDSHNPDDYRQ